MGEDCSKHREQQSHDGEKHRIMMTKWGKVGSDWNVRGSDCFGRGRDLRRDGLFLNLSRGDVVLVGDGRETVG